MEGEGKKYNDDIKDLKKKIKDLENTKEKYAYVKLLFNKDELIEEKSKLFKKYSKINYKSPDFMSELEENIKKLQKIKGINEDIEENIENIEEEIDEIKKLEEIKESDLDLDFNVDKYSDINISNIEDFYDSDDIDEERDEFVCKESLKYTFNWDLYRNKLKTTKKKYINLNFKEVEEKRNKIVIKKESKLKEFHKLKDKIKLFCISDKNLKILSLLIDQYNKNKCNKEKKLLKLNLKEKYGDGKDGQNFHKLLKDNSIKKDGKFYINLKVELEEKSFNNILAILENKKEIINFLKDYSELENEIKENETHLEDYKTKLEIFLDYKLLIQEIEYLRYKNKYLNLLYDKLNKKNNLKSLIKEKKNLLSLKLKKDKLTSLELKFSDLNNLIKIEKDIEEYIEQEKLNETNLKFRQEIQSKINNLNEEKDIISEYMIESKTLMISHKEKIDKYDKEKLKYDECFKEYNKLCYERDYLELYKKIIHYDHLQKKILLGKLDIMKKAMNSYLELYPETKIKFDYLTGAGDSLVMGYNKEGREVKAFSFSSGFEQVILSLCFRIVLFKIARVPCIDLLFIDEICGSINESNYNLTNRLLKELSNGFGKIFLISHVEKFLKELNVKMVQIDSNNFPLKIK